MYSLTFPLYRRLSNLRRLNHQAAWRRLNGSLIEPSAGWTTYGTGRAAMLLTHPPVEIFPHELIVVHLRIAVIDAINLFHLPGRKVFARVETPAARQQSLSPQNLVQAGDAAGEIVLRVEQRGVRVGDFGRPRQRVESHAAGARRFDFGE